MNTRLHALLIVSSMTVVACTASPEEPSAGTAVEPTVSVSSAILSTATYAQAAAPNDVPGFLHTFSHSKFHLGTSPSTKQEGRFSKLVGSDGVFGTNNVTGASRAILNADSQAWQRSPLTESADTHNSRVLAYFEAAGLPSDQVREAHILTHMESIGMTSEKPSPTFAGYTTVITRQVEGIFVPDSFAAARFNADDEVVDEWVYWPAIPRKAVNEAKNIATSHSVGQLVPNLPARFQNNGGEVTIRHSDFADDQGFQVFGSFDVQETSAQHGGFRGGTHCFDINGREVIHPNRRPRTVTLDTPKPH